MRGCFYQLFLGLTLGAAAPLAGVHAQGLDDSSSFAAAATLKMGGYVWLADTALPGSIKVVVSLAEQRAYVYRSGALIGITTVSTGRDGHETPTGTFPILQKQVLHQSTLYDAPMPYMQRLTWDGVALHAGGVPGYRSSHGCVHLPPGFAKTLYGMTKTGAQVVITDDTVAPPLVTAPTDPTDPAPEALAPIAAASDSDAPVRLAGVEQTVP